MSVPRGTDASRLSALDAAATVYAVLTVSVDGSVLMTVEERERTRHALNRFLTEMVEPAGFTEDDLIEHLRAHREPGLTPDELQVGAFYVAGNNRHPWEILGVDRDYTPPAYIYYREWRPPCPGRRLEPDYAILRALKSAWPEPVFRKVPHPWH